MTSKRVPSLLMDTARRRLSESMTFCPESGKHLKYQLKNRRHNHQGVCNYTSLVSESDLKAISIGDCVSVACHNVNFKKRN